MKGRIKFLDRHSQKWGFIVPSDGSPDVHFKVSDVVGPWPPGVDTDAVVDFELVEDRQGRHARRLHLLGPVGSGKLMVDNEPSRQTPEYAFYYPGHVWYSGDWIKNLLLFFDGIALLVPNYKKHEPELLDPIIATPLMDRGMLQILEAESIVNQNATQQLADAMMQIISSGALDKLAAENTSFHALSYSRLGGYGDSELADAIHVELKKRRLARDTEDGVSIPMHPLVRALVLTLLSQILRARGAELNLELSPATDRPELVEALSELLSVGNRASPGAVVAFDLETVGVDLSNVPIDEVLGFREEHRKQHQEYARAVRRFVREISLMPEQQRKSAFNDRQAEIREMANELKRISRAAWRRPAAFALSIAGAAWTLVSGNPIGAILSAGGAILNKKPGATDPAGAYSYLFNAPRRGA